MSNVAKVEPSPKNPEWRVVTMDDQRQFIVFSAKLADALQIGKPLPPGTDEEKPKFDGALPSLRLPRPQGGGGMTAWRNTKEGFEAETRGRQRWQEIEEEKRDRRTALMQAVDMARTAIASGETPTFVLTIAEDFYAWLRSSPAGGGQEATNAAQGRSQSPTRADLVGPAQDYTDQGGASISSPSSGEAAAASAEPGEDGSGKVPSPGSTRFPMAQDVCNHRFGSGNWLTPITIAGTDHCPRCGMKTVLYRESDVGP